MPASRKTQEYIEKELPYKLLMSIYEDSKASLKELGRRVGVTYHVVASTLERLEKQYAITYTLHLDEEKMGFSRGRVITIKFGNPPKVDYLKARFQKDTFVQDAYLATGDFDLLLYVVGLSEHDFGAWQYKLRIDTSEYKPNMSSSMVYEDAVGFFPMKNELIEKCEVLSDVEKRILKLLNGNSRMRLSEIIKQARTTQMRAIYSIKKMKEKGIIKQFTALSQNPQKRLIAAYIVSQILSEKHTVTRKRYWEEMLAEDFHEGVNEYAIAADLVGTYDYVNICAFENGEQMSKNGAERIRRLLEFEEPTVKSAMLTDLLTGKWPFHLEEYTKFKGFGGELAKTQSKEE